MGLFGRKVKSCRVMYGDMTRYSSLLAIQDKACRLRLELPNLYADGDQVGDVLAG